MEPAISCHNLVKTYPGKPPVEAVRGVDLEVRPGECFGVLGPNGKWAAQAPKQGEQIMTYTIHLDAASL